MGRRTNKGISIFIDEWTNSVIEVSSGNSFETGFSLLTSTDSNQIVAKDWFFDWKKEVKLTDRQVYKIYLVKNPVIIQGMISLTLDKGYVLIHYVENAKFNIGKKQIYKGVGPNLFAFACKISKENGYNGYVGFIAKTKLIDHYIKTLGANVIAGQRMSIDKNSATKLINNYFL